MKFTPLIFIASSFCSAALASATAESQGVLSRDLKKSKKTKSTKGLKKSKKSKSAKSVYFQGIKAKPFAIGLFKSIDTNDDGMIDFAEFEVPYKLFSAHTSAELAEKDFASATGQDDPDLGQRDLEDEDEPDIGQLDFECFLLTNYYKQAKEFNDIDANGDGKITAEELFASEYGPATLEEADQVIRLNRIGSDLNFKEYLWKSGDSSLESFWIADTDRDGEMSFMECMAAVAARKPGTSEDEVTSECIDFIVGSDLTFDCYVSISEYMFGAGFWTEEEVIGPVKVLFDFYDEDSDGFLTEEELGAFIPAIFLPTFRIFDTNFNGKYEFEEVLGYFAYFYDYEFFVENRQ